MKREDVKAGEVFLVRNTSPEKEFSRPMLIVSNDKYSDSYKVITVVKLVAIDGGSGCEDILDEDYLEHKYLVRWNCIRPLSSTETLEKKLGQVGDTEMLQKISMHAQDERARREAYFITLCPRCREQYLNTPGYILRRVSKQGATKDICMCCQRRLGYDYAITLKPRCDDKSCGETKPAR